MSKLSLRDQRVLVTGASSGLGLEIARQLARDFGAHPVLVARRKDRLEELATELEKLGRRPEIVPADLTRADDVERTFAEATRQPLAAAVLNAGVTFFGRAETQPPADAARIVATNVTSLVDLTQRLVPYFVGRGADAGILLVSSMAGFQPMPYQAVYGGSKAFVTHYGLALAEELRDAPLSITTFCPGGIATEMISNAGIDVKYGKDHPMVMAVEPCARLALGAFVAREKLYVPGALNKVAAVAAKLAPKGLVAHLVARDYAEALPKRG